MNGHNEPPTLTDVFGPPIHTYSRAHAFEDGELVDVSETAREAGFSIPVALTRTVWVRLVELPSGYDGWQSESGRLWDVIFMARFFAAKAANASRVPFEVHVRDIRRDGRDSAREPRVHRPIVAITAGDAGEPVVTIMFPEDD